MPEGPEVKTISDWLRKQTVGKKLYSIGISNRSRYARSLGLKGDNSPYEITLDGYQELPGFLPLEIIDVESKGKKIIFMLEGTFEEEGDTVTANVFFVSSLGMEGRWTYKEEKHCDLWLEIGDNRERLFFQDSRHFGSFDILFSIDELRQRLSDIGPDFLRDDITLEEYTEKINAIRNNKRLRKPKKVGIFLMEQEHFSGIGNYLRAEILYAAKISPHRILNDLTNDQIKALYEHSCRIIRESYQSQGATLATYKNPHGGKGDFQVLVYGKSQDPDGNDVITEDIGDKRSTHWVPAIQK